MAAELRPREQPSRGDLDRGFRQMDGVREVLGCDRLPSPGSALPPPFPRRVGCTNGTASGERPASSGVGGRCGSRVARVMHERPGRVGWAVATAARNLLRASPSGGPRVRAWPRGLAVSPPFDASAAASPCPAAAGVASTAPLRLLLQRQGIAGSFDDDSCFYGKQKDNSGARSGRVESNPDR
jgi:hypothetical protein